MFGFDIYSSILSLRNCTRFGYRNKFFRGSFSGFVGHIFFLIGSDEPLHGSLTLELETNYLLLFLQRPWYTWKKKLTFFRYLCILRKGFFPQKPLKKHCFFLKEVCSINKNTASEDVAGLTNWDCNGKPEICMEKELA